MVRGSLPAQTPLVPAESFIAFDFLYRFVQDLDIDVRLLEAGGAADYLFQAADVDNSGTDPQATDLTFPVTANKTYAVEGKLIVETDSGSYGPKIVTQLPSGLDWATITITDASGTSFFYQTTDLEYVVSGLSADTPTPVNFECTFRTGATPVGNFSLAISSEA